MPRFQPESKAPNLNPDQAKNRILFGPPASTVFDWDSQDRNEVSLVVVRILKMPSHISPESIKGQLKFN